MTNISTAFATGLITFLPFCIRAVEHPNPSKNLLIACSATFIPIALSLYAAYNKDKFSTVNKDQTTYLDQNAYLGLLMIVNFVMSTVAETVFSKESHNRRLFLMGNVFSNAAPFAIYAAYMDPKVSSIYLGIISIAISLSLSK